jgi:NADP-dependent alcohol dehydrogenase
MQGVELARKNKVDFMVAVGGGSVIDGTKFISAATNFKGDAWDIVEKGTPLTSAIPLGTVLTLSGTGSEMNCGFVVSKAETTTKLDGGDSLVYPQFSILDPTTTYSLPTIQTCNGIVDAFVHVMEQYATNYTDAPLLDRFAEGIMLTLIEEGTKVLQSPQDYNVRANIMWSATWALNDLLSSGIPGDWTTHLMGHELTAMFGLAHAQSLALLLPNVLRIRKGLKRQKLLQFAARIWNINSGTEDERIENGIIKLEQFFRKMHMKTHLTEVGISEKNIPDLIKNLEKHGRVALGEDRGITLKISEEIFRRSL